MTSTQPGRLHERKAEVGELKTGRECPTQGYNGQLGNLASAAQTTKAPQLLHAGAADSDGIAVDHVGN